MTRRHVNDRVNGDTETSIKQPLTSICLCHGSVFVQFSSAKNHAYLPNCCVFTRMYSFCNMLETKVGSFGRIGPRRQLAGVGIASADTMRSNIAILSIYIDNQIIYNSVYYRNFFQILFEIRIAGGSIKEEQRGNHLVMNDDTKLFGKK